MSATTAPLREYRLIRRVSANLDAAGTVNVMARVLGHRRVVGYFALAAGMAPAAGYPRVRWSVDGSTWNVVRVLAVDPTQATPVYPFDLAVEAPYVAIELTNGGVGGNVAVFANAIPAGA